MKSYIPCAGVLVYKDDKVLLIKYTKGAEHLTGYYGIPSGKVKPKKTKLQTALRKLRDETGLKTTKKGLIEIPILYKATIRRKGKVESFSMKVYVCKSYNGRIRKTQNEIPKWIKISELKKYKLLPNTKSVVIDGLKYR